MPSIEIGKFSFSNFSRPARLFLVVYMFFLLGGCASDAKKISPVRSQTTQLREVIQTLVEAYEQKDGKTFFEKLDPSFRLLEPFKPRSIGISKVFPKPIFRCP